MNKAPNAGPIGTSRKRRSTHCAAPDRPATPKVTIRLVDRYDRGGTSGDLFDATLWIDRYQGNEAFTRSGLFARMQRGGRMHRDAPARVA